MLFGHCDLTLPSIGDETLDASELEEPDIDEADDVDDEDDEKHLFNLFMFENRFVLFIVSDSFSFCTTFSSVIFLKRFPAAKPV